VIFLTAENVRIVPSYTHVLSSLAIYTYADDKTLLKALDIGYV